MVGKVIKVTMNYSQICSFFVEVEKIDKDGIWGRHVYITNNTITSKTPRILFGLFNWKYMLGLSAKKIK